MVVMIEGHDGIDDDNDDDDKENDHVPQMAFGTPPMHNPSKQCNSCSVGFSGLLFGLLSSDRIAELVQLVVVAH